MIEIHPITGIGEVRPGDDLAALLLAALNHNGITPRACDILVVTQKIVSKAQGRFVSLADVVPGDEAMRLAELTRKEPRLVELVLREADGVVRAAPHVLITRHRLGHVMANSGVDRSNIGNGEDDRALLLPVDPDGTAAQLCAQLGLAVVISDSFGRPWRMGVVAVAIGAAGLPALIDRRGEIDRDGRILEVTQVALADMIATAANLVTGEGAEGIPAALVRGYPLSEGNRPAKDLVRPAAEDLFR
ncbi:coenzyme F420-0:L-glutamate ligase [Novosphingobium sp. MMS21-SN21R]|uniref:coenzyme F420-0:L-glutamate ligase n=1 Tax=Novosphingobium sp. MMS21-SN21R TaxID=2969298 RepID=UPI00288385CD|nr:coenzyme F420-0:L-glutamate ligase [Novosphingobium sp. MMS21-SN21R]MDT0509803.1 coenzyme F420-0:L-glutamate ligase [Novosphingobium sp. MMS21-SN21R]